MRKGNVPASVFSDFNCEVSVDRLDRADIAEIAEVANAEMEDGRTLYAWASVTVQDARKDSRTVQSSPTETNIYHAQINLPCDKDDSDCIKFHALDLALCANCIDAP